MKRYKFPSIEDNFLVSYDRGPYLETHCHDYWEFTIIVKGKALHKINGLERLIGENTLLVIRPDDVHSLNKVDNQEIAYLNIPTNSEALKTVLSVLSNELYNFLLKEAFVEFPLNASTTTYFFNLFNKYQSAKQSQGEKNDFSSTIFISVIRELILCFHNSKLKLRFL